VDEDAQARGHAWVAARTRAENAQKRGRRRWQRRVRIVGAVANAASAAAGAEDGSERGEADAQARLGLARQLARPSLTRLPGPMQLRYHGRLCGGRRRRLIGNVAHMLLLPLSSLFPPRGGGRCRARLLLLFAFEPKVRVGGGRATI
jgi:hypothetical protein